MVLGASFGSTSGGPINLTRDVLDHFTERILFGELPDARFARADPSRWLAEQVIARRFVQFVKFGQDSLNRAFFRGFLSVRSRHGHEHGPFSVRVVYPPRFPDLGIVPSVYLMSHRDRWKSGHDSHIEPDWRLCLFVPGESGIAFRSPESLAELLGITVVFLRKEVMYQRALGREISGGPKAIWPGEDRAHGTEGLAQAVRDRGGIGDQEPCICGSGSTFRNCCSHRIGRRVDVEEEAPGLTRVNRRVTTLPRRRLRGHPEGRR